jgi:hypothetical protein
MPSTTEAEKDRIVQVVAPQMQALQLAIAEATSMIQTPNKRSIEASGLQARSCSDTCLTGKAVGLVAEISGTITGLVGKLGVSKLST